MKEELDPTDEPRDDGFAHHLWATFRLLDACDALSPEQLETTVPGTYGSLLDTLRHLVGGDTFYISHLTADPARDLDAGEMDLAELRATMEADEQTWVELLASDPDRDAVVTDADEAGYTRDATIGLRLAQALQHGTDHRSQICTALTSIGVEPPVIDVWRFGEETGRLVENPPAS